MAFSLRNWSSAQPMVPEPLSMPANPQDQSPLFTTLPIEIRRNVYKQLWMDCGLTQHIFAFTDKAYLQSFPCILSPEELDKDPSPRPPPRPDVAEAAADTNAPDVPDAVTGDENDEQDQPEPYDDPGDINGALQDLSAGPGVDGNEEPPNTPWCVHYPCFLRWGEKWGHSFSRMYAASYRHSRGWPDLRRSPVLTAFLVCRRVYAEASESLFSSVRLSFANLAALRVFLGQVPRPLVARVQFADIVAADLGFASDDRPVDSRTTAQQVYEMLRASFPKLRELRITLHPSRSGEVIPGRHALEPLYALAREMGGSGSDSLRRFEVFLPTRCDGNSELGYGEAPSSLRDGAPPPLTMKVVPPGWHEVNDCAPFDCPIRSLQE